MAKQLTQEALDHIKNDSELFGAIKDMLEVDLVTVGTYLKRNKRMFSRHDIVEATAKAMGKPTTEIFKKSDEQQEAEA